MTDREKLLLWCRKYCNNASLEDEEDFKLVLDKMIDVFDRAGIASESISDMSQSFSRETSFAVRDMLSPHKRLKVL